MKNKNIISSVVGAGFFGAAYLGLALPIAPALVVGAVAFGASELVISRLIFFRSNRCVVKLDNDQFNKKKARYLTIAKEASEQCHRNKILDIVGVIDFKDIPNYLSDKNLVAYELLAGNTISLYSELNDIDSSISLLVGPEGGLEEKEVEYLLNHSFKSVSLGKRILRCETAAIYMMSVVSFMLEK